MCHLLSTGLTLVTGGYDSSVIVWDVENMVQKLKLQVRHMHLDLGYVSLYICNK